MSEEDHRQEIGNVPNETALSVVAVVTSAIPYLGGPISSFVSGTLVKRKLERFVELLKGLEEDLRGFKDEAAEQYCTTAEFEELFEKTAQKVVDERNGEKRNLLRSFLKEAISTPTEPYDDKVRILNLIGELQAGHVRILQALDMEPDPNPQGWSGSPGETLRRRLPVEHHPRMEELLADLKGWRVTGLSELNAMMTALGAENLRVTITPFGRRLLGYIGTQ